MGGSVTIFMFIFLLELLSWGFTFMLEKLAVFKYLLVQRFFLLIRISAVCLKMEYLLILIVLLKAGIPPFHFWFTNISVFLRKGSFAFIRTFHKVISLVLLRKVLVFSKALFLVSSFVLLRGSLLLQTRRFFFVLLVSSMVHSGWISISLSLKAELGIFYFTRYSLLMILFMYNLTFIETLFLDQRHSSFSRTIWLIVAGIPPFTVFFLKISVLTELLLIRVMRGLAIIFTSVLALSIYYRAYHQSIFLTKKIFFREALLLVILLSVCTY